MLSTGDDWTDPYCLFVHPITMHSIFAAVNTNVLIACQISSLGRVAALVASEDRAFVGQEWAGEMLVFGGTFGVFGISTQGFIQAQLVAVDVDLITSQC